MKKFLSVLLILVFSIALVSCIGGTTSSDSGKPSDSTTSYESSDSTTSGGTSDSSGGGEEVELKDIIVDPLRKNGFTVNDQNNSRARVQGTIGYGDTAPDRSATDWAISQWNSGYYHREGLTDGNYPDEFNIFLAKRTKTNSGAFSWKDKAKTFRSNPETGEVTMGINGGEEYTSLRKDGQPWPHLLLEYSFTETPMLIDLNHCYLKMDYTLTKSKAMAANMSADLHAAEFLFYCVLKNVNPDSPDKGQFIWFGAQLYDNRYHDDNRHVATYSYIDTNTTSGFIYKPDSSKYCNRIPKVGSEVNVMWDMLPDMRNALLAAQSRGYLKNTEFSDLRLGSGNFGWELPGSYDVSVDISDFRIYIG